jgi:hypothetical protein
LAVEAAEVLEAKAAEVLEAKAAEEVQGALDGDSAAP